MLCKRFFIVINVLFNSIFYMLLFSGRSCWWRWCECPLHEEDRWSIPGAKHQWLVICLPWGDFGNSASSPHWWMWEIILLTKRNKTICLKGNAGLCYLSLYNQRHSYSQKSKWSIVLFCYFFSHSHHVLILIVLHFKFK